MVIRLEVITENPVGEQRLEVRLLGQFDVRLHGSRAHIPTLPARFLFAYLLLNREHPQSREKLAALFWPDATEANGRTSLRQALWRIRKALEPQQPGNPPILVADELSIAVNPAADIWLDTAILSRTAEAIEDLEVALAVYEGELLPDCYDDWAVVEREYYQALFAQKMQLLLNLLVEAQRWSEVVPWAERWITLGQAPEPAYRALMYAHAGLGDVSQVAVVYRRCQEALWRELGVEPSEHTRALRDRLVKGESSLTRGYDLRELISKSETREVYRAYQPLLNREVAVKVITPRYANLPDFIRRFETEAQLIARLEHIHIRPLYDYWRDPDGAYLVMRWLNGGNLGERLQDGPLSLEAAVRLLEQSAAALSTAHQRGIVHGNLKPDNILFDDEGNAYLTDFPIGLDSGSNPGGRNAASGFHYAAPEQIKGEPPTALSDQYSLALILYEVLTGERLDRTHPAAARGGSSWSQALPSGLPPEAGQVFDQALADLPSARFPDVLTLANVFRQVVALEVAPNNADAAHAQAGIEVANPYKGLRAFQEADAADFFGREGLVERMLDRLREPVEAARFLALVGPSGCGKSSVIHAGLIPALSQGAIPGSENWYVVRLTPGTRPLADLEADLLHIAAHQPAELQEQLLLDERGLLSAARQLLPDPGGELMLVIDHFEELFVLVEDQSEIDHFLNILASAVMEPHSAVRVIVSLRADYYDRPLMHRVFGDLMRRRTEVVIPMNADELWQAVVAPAERAGIAYEPGLPTTIVAEVMERPNALPLLQYALTELFEQREGHLLTRKTYEAIGGVSKALVRRAEVVYHELAAQERAAAKQLFLRLVNPESLGGETLRRVPLAELSSLTSGALVEGSNLDRWGEWSLDEAGLPTDYAEEYQRIQIEPGTINSVLGAFGRSRLVTFDHDPATRAPTVEVAHDALLREWSRLRMWLDENRTDLRMQRLLAASAKEWLDSGHDPSYLLHGKRLEQLQLWAEGTTMVLNQEERAFIDAGLEVHRQRQEKELAREQHELALLKQRRRRDTIFAVVGLAAILLVFAAIFFFRAAREQAEAALSGQLAAQCLSSRSEQFDRAMLLCLEALHFADTLEARNGLATLFSENPHLGRFLRGHRSAVTGVAFSQDSSLLASAAGGALYLWDLDTGEATRSEQSGEIFDLAFNAGSTLFAPAAAGDLVFLRQLASGVSYDQPVPIEGVTSVAMSPDNKMLALGTADGRILFWDVPFAQLSEVELAGRSGPVTLLAFSPDGSTLASGGPDHSLVVWDRATGDSRLLADHTSPVLALAFSPDGRFLASSSAGGSILLSDLAHNPISSARLQKDSRADALAFSPNGTQLAAGFIDGSIALWDVPTGRSAGQEMIGHSGAVKALAYSPDGRMLASGSADRDIILWDLVTNQTVHKGAVSGVSFQPGGTRFATGSVDGRVQFWDLERLTGLLPAFEGQPEGVNDVSFSPDGRYVASAGRDGTIALLDGASGKELATLAGHDALVTSVTFSPDGAKLASGSADSKIILWDTASGEALGPPLAGHDDWVYSVAFSPDGELLASGGQDGMIILWDAGTGQAVGEPLRGHKDWIYGLTFSPDGRWLASGGADNLAILWDLSADPARAMPLVGHADYVFDVAFSQDNRQLYTASADGFIRSWDVETGQAVGQPFKAHQGAVYSLDASADGEWLVSGGHDAAVRLWRTNLAAWACESVGRNLTRAEWEAALQGQTPENINLLDLTYHRTCLQWPLEG